MESQFNNQEIENEIKIETPSPVQEAIPNQNENINPNENSNENNIVLRPKKVLLNKNANNETNNNNNSDLLSEDNLDHPKPLSSDYYDEGKGDIRKLFEEKKIKKPNRIRRIKRLEDYLDDDLDDDENKKIYLRVIKRLEKTLGLPVIGVKLSGESINNIELEENIRPITFNENNKARNSNKFNRVGISVNDKKFIIKSNIEKNQNQNQNQINNNSNNKKRYDNQIVKINEGNILNNVYDNIIFDNNIKKPEDIDKKIIKTIYNNNKEKKVNSNIVREDLSLIKNKYANIFGKQKNNKQNANRQNIQNNNDNRYNNNNNPNNTNTKVEIQKFHYSNSKININSSTTKKRILISTGSYSKLNTQYNLNKNLNLPLRKISFENSSQNQEKSVQNQEKKQKNTQNLINSIKINNQINDQNNNQKNNQQIINQMSNSNRIERKQIKNIKNLKNQNISNVTKTNATKQFNTNVIPDMQRGTNIFVKENESELKSGKIKTQTYIRGGKFNNVQTTYVTYSKKDNKNNTGIKKGNNCITIKASEKNNNNYNNKIEKSKIKNTAEIFSRTPEKKHALERPISRVNQELVNTYYKSKNNNENDKNNINKKDQVNPFNSPEKKLKNINRINSNQSAENPKKTQNFIAVNRNNIDNNNKTYNFTVINTNSTKTARFQDFNKDENSTFKLYRIKRNEHKLDSKEKKLFANNYVIQSTNSGK